MRYQALAGKLRIMSAVIMGLATMLQAGRLSAAEYLVKFNDAKALPDSHQTLSQIKNVQYLDQHVAGQIVKVAIPDSDKAAASTALQELYLRGDVEYIVPNFKLYAIPSPNDPSVGQQWALAKVRAAQAWDIGVGSRAIKVAVIDTGVDYRHPDLAANIWTNPTEIAGNGIDDDNNGFVDDVHGYDFHGNDADPMDETGAQNPGHGTHCSGIIGAVGNNGVGISGMSQMVSIVPVRFLGADGSGDLMASIKAIDYGIKIGVQVMSASWGAAVPRAQAAPLVEAIQRAEAANIVFVAAAGNDGRSNDGRDMFPANAGTTNMITVAASNDADAKPTWSNFGIERVSLASPGDTIYSTLPSDRYGNLSGTSMATPMVAGLVAMMKAQDTRNLSPQDLKSLLQATGTQSGIETACECRIDAANVMVAVRDGTMVISPNAITLRKGQTQQFRVVGERTGAVAFASTNTAAATIDAAGILTAVENGETTIKVTDERGGEALTHKIRIAPENTGGGGGECPLPDPMICLLLCQLMPELPWC